MDWKIVTPERMIEIHGENESQLEHLQQQIASPAITSLKRQMLEKRLDTLKKNWDSLNDIIDELQATLNLLNSFT